MKRIILIAGIVVFAAVGCNNTSTEDEKVSTDLVKNPNSASESNEVNEEDLAKIEFKEEVINFGEVSQGEKVKKRFRFKNTGKSNLIISNATGSCGCTVPLWPKQPIRPGQEGEIEVVFDSNGKQGRVHNTVTLIANTQPNKTVVALKGDVIVPNKN
ncbi:MAG: DUF1573 domain-containing protein [Vicingaceae bacterium]